MVLRTLGPTLRTLDTRSAQPPPKTADPELLTPEHRAWRAEVLRRAGFRCEWIDGRTRCHKASPAHRLFADHIKERKDGGAPLDPANGMCLCGSHHTLKTNAARTQRFAATFAVRTEGRGEG